MPLAPGRTPALETRPPRRVGGLLLTGGSSRRMGTDKAALVVGGQTLAVRGAKLLSQVTSPSLEVGPGHSGLRATQEDPPGSGPLAAIVAGWVALRESSDISDVIVLAVDMPMITQGYLAWLADLPLSTSAVPCFDGHSQPLAARYPAAAMATGVELIRTGRRSMKDLLAACDVTYLESDQWSAPAGSSTALTDVDTPEELQAVLSGLRGEGRRDTTPRHDRGVGAAW